MRLNKATMLSNDPPNRTVQLFKNWGRVYSYHSLALRRLWSRFREHTDLARIDRLREETAEVVRRDPVCAAKYADYALWAPFNLARIGALSLQDLPPLRSLDIGCGPGYFLAMARAAGHECLGIDAPSQELSAVELRVYSELLAALYCSSHVYPVLIERFLPMPVTQENLDLITAFWITFNRIRQPDEWGVAEWRFFVEDAVSHFSENGTLHLELNSHAERYGTLEWYDAETLEFFRSVGTVERGVVRIRRDCAETDVDGCYYSTVSSNEDPPSAQQ
jgi:SAM-dependent methyltransferase